MDHDIIQVHHHNSFCYQVIEDVVHHGLEHFWTIAQSKKHNQQFEKPSVCLERSLPLVSFFYLDIVEPPSDIKFGEVLGSSEFIDEFGDEREQVFVLDHHRV